MINPLLRTLSIAILGCLAVVPHRTGLAQVPPAAVAATRVVQREVAAEQTFVATIIPTRRVSVGSAASGRVAEFLYEEGDRVEAMQPIVQLLTETIESERAAAEAELEMRKQELEELNNGSRPEEIKQTRAMMLAAEARRSYAETNWKRVQQLFKQGGSSVAERDEAVNLYANAVNEYIAAEAAYNLAEAGPREEKKLQAQAAVRMQEAIVKKLTDQQRKHTIITRFTGFIVNKYTEVGAWVNTGDLVAEIVALDQVDAETFVTESQVEGIRINMNASVVIPALNRSFPGRVAEIIPDADIKTRTFPVHVRVDNEIHDDVAVIKSGMLARVQLPIGPKQEALLVHSDALVFSGETASVFVVRPDPKKANHGTVRPVTVKPGVTKGVMRQVTGDIEKGDLVVMEGNERIRPGQEVMIAEIKEPTREDFGAVSPGQQSGTQARVE